MSELAELKGAVKTIRRIVAELEPGCVRGDDALAWLSAFVEVERLGAAGRTLMAARVEQSNVWRPSGERSAAQFLAHTTGTSVGRAQSVLETAARLEQLPATADAFRTATLSESQVQEVAAAAAVSPASEARLLERADGTLKQLRDECRRVRHAGTDEQARYDAIRRNRCLRTWTDGEGAVCGQFRTTPDAGARMLAALDAEIDRVFRSARREGRREPRAAYAMDALEALVCSGAGAGAGARRKPPRTVINVLVDYEALVRGHTVAGETCEIAGIGSVPVSVVASWQRRLPEPDRHPRRRHQGGDPQLALCRRRPAAGTGGARPQLCHRALRRRVASAARPPRPLRAGRAHRDRQPAAPVPVPPRAEDQGLAPDGRGRVLPVGAPRRRWRSRSPGDRKLDAHSTRRTGSPSMTAVHVVVSSTVAPGP